MNGANCRSRRAVLLTAPHIHGSRTRPPPPCRYRVPGDRRHGGWVPATRGAAVASQGSRLCPAHHHRLGLRARVGKPGHPWPGGACLLLRPLHTWGLLPLPHPRLPTGGRPLRHFPGPCLCPGRSHAHFVTRLLPPLPAGGNGGREGAARIDARCRHSRPTRPGGVVWQRACSPQHSVRPPVGVEPVPLR